MFRKRLNGIAVFCLFTISCSNLEFEVNKRAPKNGTAPLPTNIGDNANAGGDQVDGTQNNADGTPLPGNEVLDEAIANDPAALNLIQSFNTDIYPLLKANCESCHVGPRVDVPNRGPQSIYSAITVSTMMKNGVSSTNNSFFRKIAGVGHIGGNRCGATPQTTTPCKEVIAWAQKHYKDDGIVKASDLTGFGFVNAKDLDGTFFGFAYNPDNPAETISVEIYKGGPMDNGGTLVASGAADLPGIGAAVSGNHRFQIKIPDAIINEGVEETYYTYAILGAEKKAISENSREIFYIPNVDFFNGTSLANPPSCAGCHVPRTAKSALSILAFPRPTAGGSPTNNIFYQKAAGVNHGGGNICANNNNVCAEIMAWWTNEFGNLPQN